MNLHRFLCFDFLDFLDFFTLELEVFWRLLMIPLPEFVDVDCSRLGSLGLPRLLRTGFWSSLGRGDEGCGISGFSFDSKGL